MSVSGLFRPNLYLSFKINSTDILCYLYLKPKYSFGRSDKIFVNLSQSILLSPQTSENSIKPTENCFKWQIMMFKLKERI